MGAPSASDPDAHLDDRTEHVSVVFENERVGLTRMATLLVGSSTVAEEVVQDAFVSASARWAQIDRPGAYVRTSVVRGCAAVLRRREIEGRYLGASASPAVDELPTHLIELRDALEHLSDRQRAVIVLRYFVDLPDDQIAETLDIRPSTVRSLNRRALAVLRKELS